MAGVLSSKVLISAGRLINRVTKRTGIGDLLGSWCCRALVGSEPFFLSVGGARCGATGGHLHCAGVRIVSLLPSATEIVCLLGLEDQLVGVSADSDWPVEVVKRQPVLNTVSIDTSQLTSKEI